MSSLVMLVFTALDLCYDKFIDQRTAKKSTLQLPLVHNFSALLNRSFLCTLKNF